MVREKHTYRCKMVGSVEIQKKRVWILGKICFETYILFENAKKEGRIWVKIIILGNC